MKRQIFFFSLIEYHSQHLRSESTPKFNGLKTISITFKVYTKSNKTTNIKKTMYAMF